MGPSFTCIVTSEPLQWRHSVRTGEERLARDLVRRLLVRDTTQRLGCMKRSTLDVTEHKFYDTLDWDEVSLEFHFRIERQTLKKMFPPLHVSSFYVCEYFTGAGEEAGPSPEANNPG